MSGPPTLEAVAAALPGTLRGDGSLLVRRPVPPHLASEDGDLAIALTAEAREALRASPARMAVLPEGTDVPPALAGAVLVRRGPTAMARLLRLFARPPQGEPGIHPRAEVDPRAELGEDVSVGPFCWVGPGARIGAGSRLLAHVTVGAEARLGRDVVLHPGVRIGERVVLGDRVVVHPNAVLGADGFSYATAEPGSVETLRASGRVEARNTGIEKVPSLGTVIIGDDVEIGAGTAIDRGTLEATTVGAGTRIDDLVMIAHNTVIGRDCLIAGQAGLSGSCRLGDRVVLAGQVGVADHITIGDDAVVLAQAGVARHVPARAVRIGSPAVPREEFLAQLLDLKRFARLRSEVAALRRELDALKSRP